MSMSWFLFYLFIIHPDVGSRDPDVQSRSD